MLLMMRGGEMVTGETLTRFFAGHVIILPVATIVLLGLHFLMIRRQGISGSL
jgi:quinol-cytochrome oxidoreductase complex cytochrome b subunit